MPAKPKTPTLPTAERLRAFQSAVMAVESAMGSPVKEIAKRWEVSEGSVRNRLGEVVASGFYKAFEEAMLSRLVPQALAVMESHLQMGSYEAARDLLHGLGVLSRSAPLRAAEGKGGPGEARDPAVPASLDAWRASRAEGVALATLKKIN